MDLDKDQSRAAVADLRGRAERQLQAKTAVNPSRSNDETERLVHELEVHQVELSMQNAELRQARDELEAALEKYTDLYDFAPVGYFTLDRNGIITAMNHRGATLLGSERSRLVGRHLGQLVTAATRPAFASCLKKVFTSRVKEACEVALLKEGDPLFVQIEAVSFGSGQECHVALIDISERRQLEKRLEILHTALAAHATELEAANIELEAFNYTVAHDLRKPLTVINGYCQAIKELCGAKLEEPCKGYLQEAYDGTWRMNRLIDSLLEFSRLAHVELQRQPVELTLLAHEVAAGLKLAEPGRRVTFQIASGVSANGDAALLRVVLDNLLGNAFKYTARREDGVVEFGTTEVAGRKAYFVRDNGSGFDMACEDKLFTPFQRLPGAEECRGFGIGLATVERVIRRHGGTVWAEGAPGKGATFYFTLASGRD